MVASSWREPLAGPPDRRAALTTAFDCAFVAGPTACALYAMTGSLFGNTSIWTMIFIALDRYNVIVKV